MDNPEDHGGPTQCGITLKAWSEFCGHQATVDELRRLTPADVRRFYFEVYWSPLGLASWHPTVATAVFDMAVVSGSGRAMVLAQRALGVAADGIPGPKTAKAAGPNADAAGFLLRFVPLCALRFAGIVAANPTQAVFLVGWIARAVRLLQLSAG